jgi:hypothetical protein
MEQPQTMIELKAYVYDCMAKVEHYQGQITIANQQIAKIAMESSVNDVKKDEKPENKADESVVKEETSEETVESSETGI